MIRNRIILALFLAAFVYFLFGGIISYSLANYFDFAHYDFDYGIDLLVPTLYSLGGLALFGIGYWTSSQVGSMGLRLRTPVASSDSVTSVQLWAVSLLFAVGVVGLLGMIGQYGGRIPAFAEHADEFRTQVSSGLPQILYFQLVVSSLLAYSLRAKLTGGFKRTYLTWLLVASLFMIYLGASRSMLVTPVLVIMLDLWTSGRLRTWKAACGLLAAGLGVFLIGLYRMDSQLEQGIYLLRFVNDFAPEFREFAKVVMYFPDKVDYLKGQMLVNAVMILVPGTLLDLIGATKSVYWQPFGEYLKDLFGYQFAGGGLRAGLIAEMYANFGLFGVAGGFLCLGGLAHRIDRSIRGARSIIRPVLIVVGVSVASSLLFTFDAVVYKILALSAGWYLFRASEYVLQNLSRPATAAAKEKTMNGEVGLSAR